MCRRIAAVMVFSLVLAIGAASTASAQMEFSVDMNQDGTADANWPLAVGDMVTLDIVVSNIPAPGLGTMGFILTYNDTILDVTEAVVDPVNWPSLGLAWTVRYPNPGEIEFRGYRLPEVTGLSGDNIPLATVTFERIALGEALLRIEDPNTDPENGSFVLLDETVLDGDIGVGGVSLATIQPPIPGDVSGDGLVDLADAVLALQVLSATGTSIGFATGDVSGDGAVGIEEGIWILQDVAGLR